MIVAKSCLHREERTIGIRPAVSYGSFMALQHNYYTRTKLLAYIETTEIVLYSGYVDVANAKLFVDGLKSYVTSQDGLLHVFNPSWLLCMLQMYST